MSQDKNQRDKVVKLSQTRIHLCYFLFYFSMVFADLLLNKTNFD